MLDFTPSAYDSVPHSSLVELAQDGGPEADPATTALLRAHVPLLRLYTNKAPFDLVEDAEAEAISGFLTALARFNPAKGTTIGTYAAKFVKGSVVKFLRSELTYRNKSCSLFDETGGIDPNIDVGKHDLAFDQVVRYDELRPCLEAQQRWFRRLPLHHKTLIKDLFLNGLSQSDIARKMNVSRSAVSKTWAKVRASGMVAIGGSMIQVRGEQNRPLTN